MKLPIAAGVLATVKILVQRMAPFLLVQRMATAFPEPPAVTQVLAEAQEPGLHQPSMATAEQVLAKRNIRAGQEHAQDLNGNGLLTILLIE